MTYEEIAAIYPEEAAARKADKFNYRYPRGESYNDLIARLEPIAHEMERRRAESGAGPCRRPRPLRPPGVSGGSCGASATPRSS